MELLIGGAHIVGAVLMLCALGLGILKISAWENERNGKQQLEEAAIKLGVAVSDLNADEVNPEMIQYFSERYSGELFKNRFSDFCGLIRMVWDWLGAILQWAFLIGVIWYSITDGIETAVYAWAVLPIALFFWISGVIFALVCRLVTGRYPGQAKMVRKALSNHLNSRAGAL